MITVLTAISGNESVPSPDNYLDWSYVPYAASSGSMLFKNMVNMRCNYFFRYYRDLPNSEYQLLAESNEVAPAGGFNMPMHGRLSLTESFSEMRVTWTSGSQQVGIQKVRYDTDCEDIYDVAVDGSSHDWQFVASNSSAPSSYRAEDMCGHPATKTAQFYYRNPGYFHTVTLKNLNLNTKYCYQFGNDIDGFSAVSYFKTSPGVDGHRGVSFVAYGDMGVGPGYDGKTTALRVASELPYLDFLLHFGDISYARGDLRRLQLVWVRLL